MELCLKEPFLKSQNHQKKANRLLLALWKRLRTTKSPGNQDMVKLFFTTAFQSLADASACFFLGAMVPFSTCKVCSTRCSTFLSCDLHICSISYSHLYVQKYPKSMLFFIYDIQTYRISSPNPRVQLASSIASWRGYHDYQWSVNRFLRANCRLMKKKAMMNCIWF